MLCPSGCGLLVTFLSLSVGLGQRRIMEGSEPSRVPNGTLPSYVVYLVEQRENRSAARYSDGAWMCAGAVIHESFVLTSGACLSDITGNKKRIKDLSPLWVISGTSHYIYGSETNALAQKCVDNTKRLVNKTYIPYSSAFSYTPIEKWVALDIGIAQVDRVFALDGVPGVGCDYAVSKIDVNYDEAHQRDGASALVFGWGHTGSFRELGDRTNRNSPKLRYAPVMLMNKLLCSKEWLREEIQELIMKHMVCTKDGGRLNDQGEPIITEDTSPTKEAGFIVINGVSYMKECGGTRQGPQRAGLCVSDGSCVCPSFTVDRTRRADGGGGVGFNSSSAQFVVRAGRVYWRVERPPARALRYRYEGHNYGFCQNDHGAPLVAWAGPRLKLIGVASAFLVRPDASLACVGPYIYMSTHCNGAFIKCVLSNTSSECSEVTKNNLRIAVTSVFIKSSQKK